MWWGCNWDDINRSIPSFEIWTCVCVWGEWVVLPQPAKPSLAELQFLGETEQGTGSILWLQSMKCSRLLGPGQCSGQLLRPNVCPTGKVRECHRTHHRLLELVKRHALTTIKTIANIHRSPHWSLPHSSAMISAWATTMRLGCWLFKALMYANDYYILYI
jgi:hypothetical protein